MKNKDQDLNKSLEENMQASVTNENITIELENKSKLVITLDQIHEFIIEQSTDEQYRTKYDLLTALSSLKQNESGIDKTDLNVVHLKCYIISKGELLQKPKQPEQICLFIRQNYERQNKEEQKQK